MSYALTPVLVDLEEVRKVIGCKDETLIGTVIDRYSDDFVQGQDDDDSSKIDLSQAVRHLIMGEELDRDSSSQYLHAFELICAHLGEVVLPDAWGGVGWAALADVGLDAVLVGGPPVNIPPDEFGPRVGYLTAADIAARVTELGDGHLASNDPDDQELLEEYEGWLREAASKNKSIVFFI